MKVSLVQMESNGDKNESEALKMLNDAKMYINIECRVKNSALFVII